MKYTKEKVYNTACDFFKKGTKITKLYKEDFILWRGKGAEYTEIVSDVLLKNNIKKKLDSIAPRERKSSYKVQHKYNRKHGSNRSEELFAYGLVGMEIKGLGRVLDHQVPLKGKRKDRGSGKIDLVSYARPKTIYLIELKYGKNTETLLRAALEIYTYSRWLDKKKFIRDFEMDPKSDIKSALLLGNTTYSYAQAERLSRRRDSQLKKLIRNLGVNIFLLQDANKTRRLK